MGCKMTKIQKKRAKAGKPQRKSLTMTQKVLMFIGLFIGIITALPAVVVILIGLLPTITVMITDPKNTNKLIIVGGFNLAGVFIYLVNIVNHFTVQNALFIVSNIFNLIIMLGSAAIGLIIYCELPNLFVLTSKISAQKRLKSIDSRLEKLGEEWGGDAISTQSPAKETAPENKS